MKSSWKHWSEEDEITSESKEQANLTEDTAPSSSGAGSFGLDDIDDLGFDIPL